VDPDPGYAKQVAGAVAAWALPPTADQGDVHCRRGGDIADRVGDLPGVAPLQLPRRRNRAGSEDGPLPLVPARVSAGRDCRRSDTSGLPVIAL